MITPSFYPFYLVTKHANFHFSIINVTVSSKNAAKNIESKGKDLRDFAFIKKRAAMLLLKKLNQMVITRIARNPGLGRR